MSLILFFIVCILLSHSNPPASDSQELSYRFEQPLSTFDRSHRGRNESTPENCPLTSIYSVAHTCLCLHILISETQNNKQIIVNVNLVRLHCDAYCIPGITCNSFNHLNSSERLVLLGFPMSQIRITESCCGNQIFFKYWNYED